MIALPSSEAGSVFRKYDTPDIGTKFGDLTIVGREFRATFGTAVLRCIDCRHDLCEHVVPKKIARLYRGRDLGCPICKTSSYPTPKAGTRFSGVTVIGDEEVFMGKEQHRVRGILCRYEGCDHTAVKRITHLYRGLNLGCRRCARPPVRGMRPAPVIGTRFQNVTVVSQVISVEGKRGRRVLCTFDGCEHSAPKLVDNLYRGIDLGCKQCHHSKKYDSDQLKGLLSGRPLSLLSTEIGSTKEKATFLCHVCKLEFTARFTSVIQSGTGCPRCWGAPTVLRSGASVHSTYEAIFGELLWSFGIKNVTYGEEYPTRIEKKRPMQFDFSLLDYALKVEIGDPDNTKFSGTSRDYGRKWAYKQEIAKTFKNFSVWFIEGGNAR